MQAEITSRYESNLARVRALVAVYQEKGGAGSGRRAVATTDVLRAAVVFLHATLEDVLRTVQARRWPSTMRPEHLESLLIPIGGERNAAL